MAGRSWRYWAQRIAPWLVAAAVLAYLAATIPAAEVGRALQRVSLPAFAALVVAYVAATLAADSFAMWVGFREALPAPRLSYLDVLTVRGASYLLAILNYGAGQGGVVYLLRRNHGVPLGAGAGAVLLTAGAFLIVVSLAAGLGLIAGALPDDGRLQLVVLALAAGLPVYLAVVAWRPAFLARRAALAPLFAAGVDGTLRVAAARCLHAAVLVAGHFAALHLFGVAVPLSDALERLPLVFLVGTLPIAPAGLGTAQATAVALFAPWGSQAAVLAYSLSLHVAGLAVQAGLGLLFLRRVQPPA